MKRLPFLLLAFGLFITAGSVAAQQQEHTTVYQIELEDPEPGETEEIIIRRVGFDDADHSSYNYSPSNFPKRWKWDKGHWAGVGLTYGGLVKNLGGLHLPESASYMKQKAGSIGVHINFVDFVIVSNRHFGLITGLGLEINNFRFDNNIGLTQNEQGYIVADNSYTERGVGLEKSKLTTTYLNVPLLAEFQFGRSQRKAGFVNFGLIGGLRLEGHTKVKGATVDGKFTHKQHGQLNLRNFHWGMEMNVGYKHYALTARYYPQSIFKADQGPDVQQVNIGLTLMF